MARKVFYSFYYDEDNWRASKVRNIGAIEGNQPAKDNDWETVKKGGDPAIEKWIKGQMEGRTCSIVLIGANTAGRKWINYEIVESWKRGMGLLGIYIHKITDRFENQSSQGANPFSGFNINGKPFDGIVKAYNPPHYSSKDTYNYIAENLEKWIEEAIRIRNAH